MVVPATFELFGNDLSIKCRSFKADCERYNPETLSHTYNNCDVFCSWSMIFTNITPLIGRRLLSTPFSLCDVGISQDSGICLRIHGPDVQVWAPVSAMAGVTNLGGLFGSSSVLRIC